MLISLYIMFAIVGFLAFFLAVFFNEDVKNLFLWPVAVIIFSSLFFASYNLQTSTTIVSSQNVTLINATNSVTSFTYDKDTTYFREIPFSYMFLGLALLSLVLFLWDLWSKYKE